MYLFKLLPSPLYSVLLKFAAFLRIPGTKYASEFYYWHTRLKREGGTLKNHWYRNLMLEIAGENDDDFVSGKTIADFGCGPRGSLCWATGANKRIGIDILVNQYKRLGIYEQNMEYIQSSESSIPLESSTVDILFTINAMDHVDNFETICDELIRILKPGGEFIGSFNLEEEATICEPQTLTEDKIRQSLLRHFTIQHYRMAKPGPKGNHYIHFRDHSEPATDGPRYLWVRAQKPL